MIGGIFFFLNLLLHCKYLVVGSQGRPINAHSNMVKIRSCLGMYDIYKVVCTIVPLVFAFSFEKQKNLLTGLKLLPETAEISAP